jgi:hypothetical protein
VPLLAHTLVVFWRTVKNVARRPPAADSRKIFNDNMKFLYNMYCHWTWRWCWNCTLKSYHTTRNEKETGDNIFRKDLIYVQVFNNTK